MSFATCTIGVWSRPKRGTYCFSSLIWHDPRVENTIMRFSSILFFSIGFVGCPPYQRVSQDSLLADQDVNSFVYGDTPDSLGVCHTTCRSSLYCFWDRDDDVDLYREPHRKSPLCDLYDFRQLSQDADGLVSNHSRKGRFGRVSASGHELRDCRWELCCRSY